jgi:galactokinase
VPTTAKLRMVSSSINNAKDQVVEERTLSASDDYEAPPEEQAEGGGAAATAATTATTAAPLSWPTYVVGTVAQYMHDLPKEGCVLDLALSFASNVPLGAGLSSSAALEVAAATVLECFLHDDLAYSSLTEQQETALDRTVVRALRCQKAENEWAHSPCGIMDQLASSAAKEGHLMLIDCRSMEITNVPMKKGADQPVILVTNSKVEHEIADSEYGLRRKECNEALDAMQQVPLYHVLSLRDATLQDVDTAKDIMGETAFRRAKHVVTENSRTMECKTALKLGLWERVGELMNSSHKSLKDEFEVSCDEINFLVDICQEHPGVYGSRITGGGFGGCIVTLVQKEHVEDLIAKLKEDYKEVLDKECDCFVTHPSFGATVLAIDMDCKP